VESLRPSLDKNGQLLLLLLIIIIIVVEVSYITDDFDVEVLELSVGCADVETGHLVALDHIQTIATCSRLAWINHVHMEWRTCSQAGTYTLFQ